MLAMPCLVDNSTTMFCVDFFTVMPSSMKLCGLCGLAFIFSVGTIPISEVFYTYKYEQTQHKKRLVMLHTNAKQCSAMLSLLYIYYVMFYMINAKFHL